VLALVAALVLSGCAAQPAQHAEPTPESSTPAEAPIESEPAAEPVDPLQTVASIVARAEALELRAGDGTVVATIDFAGPADVAVDTLTAVLGGPPVDESYEGGNHHAPGVIHTWDDALVVDEIHYGEGVMRDGAATVGAPDFRVSFDAVEVRGKVLATSDGIRVGDSFESLGEKIDPDLWTCMGWAAEFIELPDPNAGTVKIGVGLSEWAWDEAAQNYGLKVDHVASIMAPTPVAAGCV